MEDSIFTKIIKRELPAEIIYEDDLIIVILNRFPTIEGETLVITKEQVPYIFDLSEETYAHVFRVAKRMAKALDLTFSPLRTCVLVEGFEVPHVHVRLYPVTTPPLRIESGPMATDEELQVVGEKIRAALTQVP